jgi:anti-anti-sigma regulatory factor
MFQTETLGYTVTIHNPMLVILFSGTFSVSCVETLEQCKDEALQTQEVSYVIVDFSNVKNFSLDGVPALAQFQKTIRARQLELRLCGLSEELRAKLVRLGVVRQAELSPSLKDALFMIKRGVKPMKLAPEAEEDRKKAA